MSPAPLHLPLPTNHVFVDYENVHEIDLTVIGQKAISFTLLLGAKHTKLDVNLVQRLIEHASSVHLLRLESVGKNALDFTLAFYLGKAVANDPIGFFHIISRDKGFDPLVEHLRSRHVKIRRHDNFETLTFSGPNDHGPNAVIPPKGPSQPGDLLGRVLDHLRKNKTNRPKRKGTLMRHLVAFAGNHGSEKEVQEVIERLQKAGQITIGEKESITYRL